MEKVPFAFNDTMEKERIAENAVFNNLFLKEKYYFVL